MVTSLEPVPDGWGGGGGAAPQEGILIWDVSDPADPKQLGHWRTGNRGTHRNYYGGGRYIHAAASMPGIVGRSYVAVDIDDPDLAAGRGPVVDARPERGWRREHSMLRDDDPDDHRPAAGQRRARDARRAVPGRRPGVLPVVARRHGRAGHRGHHPARVRLPVDRLPAAGQLGRDAHRDPAAGAPTSPIVNDEAIAERREEPLNFAGLVDLSDETDPMLMSLFPLPEVPPGAPEGYFLRGGRFGPHNQHQPQGQPSLAPSR